MFQIDYSIDEAIQLLQILPNILPMAFMVCNVKGDGNCYYRCIWNLIKDHAEYAQALMMGSRPSLFSYVNKENPFSRWFRGPRVERKC